MASGRVVDLTMDDDGEESSTSVVFVVIHDGEPQDSSMHHQTQDSKIIGVFTSKVKAIDAAFDYLEHEMCFIEAGEGDDEYDDEGGYEEWREEAINSIDWFGNGFYRREEIEEHAPNDRIYVRRMRLDQIYSD
jgi:hypothetical protein